MKSLADVARHAGVSKATASRALNGSGYVSEATRDRVSRSAAELGYVLSTAAASLVTGRTRNVAVVTPHLSRWFFSKVVDGVEEALIEAGYDLTLYRLRQNETQRRKIFDYFLVRKRVDAVISVGVELEAGERRALTAMRKPVVCVSGTLPGVHSIRIDDFAATRTSTEHLLQLGHTDIVYVGAQVEGDVDLTARRERVAGFEAAMTGRRRRRGDVLSCGWSLPEGYEAGRALLTLPADERPAAIVAGTDELAMGVVMAARDLGLEIPRDLSITGIDDHPYSAVFGLTTIRQEPAIHGHMAVDAILGHLDSGRPMSTDEVLVEATLIPRSTTARATAHSGHHSR
ncbi:MAG: LacI family DNA-binding transcriptional regulator [Naasia sp.]